jgi:hypothetical protein
MKRIQNYVYMIALLMLHSISVCGSQPGQAGQQEFIFPNAYARDNNRMGFFVVAEANRGETIERLKKEIRNLEFEITQHDLARDRMHAKYLELQAELDGLDPIR